MSQSGASTTSGSGAPPIETLTGNSGGPVGPDASFNINILGNNGVGIDVVGTPAMHQLMILGIQATTSQIGVVELATNAQAIAGTDTNNAVTSAALAAKLGTQTLHGLPIGAGTSSAIIWTASPTNGQLLIGNTGNNPTLNTLTAGVGIAITNGTGSITISATGLTWTDNSGSFNAAAGHGYFITNTSTPTLPNAPAEGDTIAFILDTTNIATITANTGQKIRLGTALSAASGTCASNFQGDAITLIYRTVSNVWLAMESLGTWTIT